MFKPISIFLLLALAAPALLIAGCGGSDDEATGSAGGEANNESGPPSKAEFAKQAESICAKSKEARYDEAVRYRQEHEKELEALEPIPAEEQIIRAVTLPSILKEAKELQALGAPKGDEEMVEAIVTGLEAGVKEAEKDPYSISLEVPSEYPFRKVGEAIRAYGLTACRNPA